MSNQAIAQNPAFSSINITSGVSSFLFAVFTLMFVTGVGLLVWGYKRPVGERAFHHLAASVCFTAAVAYFAMASNLGSTPVAVEFIRGGNLGQQFVDAGIATPTRALYYARYIDWTITTPLLLLELLLATGLPLSEIWAVLYADEVMIIGGLIGGLVASQYRWAFFVFACLAEGFVGYVLLGPARISAARLGPEWGEAYRNSAIILSGLWLLYPLVWGLSEGGNVISSNGEMIFYGLIDFLAKPCFCIYHCWAIQKCDYRRLGFVSGKYSEASTHEELSFNRQAGINPVVLERVVALEKAVGVEPTAPVKTDHEPSPTTTVNA